MKSNPKTPPRRFDPATIHLLQQLAWGLLVISVCALMVTAVWYVTRLSALTISTVTAEGGITIPHAEVERRAAEVLEGTYLKLIPRRFVYAYPEDELLSAMGEIPRIKDVTLNRIGRTTLTIQYGEYVPDSLWCSARGATDCLFLDETGLAFGPAPDLKGGSFIRYYAPLRAFEVGQTPFGIDDYQITKEFTARLAETGWYVQAIEIDSVRDVFYLLGGGGELKATLTESPEKILENLNTIRASKEFAHLTPDVFEYIDLRFGTKVFVNEKKEAPALSEGVATTTATSTPEDAPSE